jgi:polar amino acid transport system substrate-binding protein
MINAKRILSAVFIIICLVCDYSHAEETWKITSLNWEPYSGDTLTNQGNSVQKLREILKRKGIRLLVEFYSWLRSQKKAASKEYIGYFPAWPEEVAEGFIASSIVDWSEVGLMKHKDVNLKSDKIDELILNHRLGFVKTYVYPDIIANVIKKYVSKVDGSPNEFSLLKKLSTGRIEIAITDPNVMIYLADKEGISNIEPVRVFMQKELVVACRNDEENKHRIKILNQLLIEYHNKNN